MDLGTISQNPEKHSASYERGGRQCKGPFILHALTAPKVTWSQMYSKQQQTFLSLSCLYQIQRKGEASSSILPSSPLQ